MKKLVESGANINIYTFHGGTNFGCFAGANYDVKYKPTVTSYDDAALLNEFGDYTPAYHRVRKILRTAQGLPLDEPLPPRPKLQAVGEVTFKESADLWQTVRRLGDEHNSAAPECMEKFGLDHGYILYTTKIEGKYGAMKLSVEGVHDVAYIRLDGKLVKTYYRTSNRNKKRADGFICSLPPIKGAAKLEILVESMGRTITCGESAPAAALNRIGARKLKFNSYMPLFAKRAYYELVVPEFGQECDDVEVTLSFGGLDLQMFEDGKLVDDCFNTDGKYVFRMSGVTDKKQGRFIIRVCAPTKRGGGNVYNETGLAAGDTALKAEKTRAVKIVCLGKGERKDD